MPVAAYGILLAGAIAGGFVSGLAGFGTALMALGIWLYVLPPSMAVTLVIICSIIAQTWTLPSMWRSFDLSLVWPFLIGGLAGVPVGTLLIAHADPRVFKLSMGILLLVFPVALLLNRDRIAFRFGGKFADGAIGFAGGILGGLAGLSGPLPTLWASLRLGQGRAARRIPDLQLDDPGRLTMPAICDGSRQTGDRLAHLDSVARHDPWRLGRRKTLSRHE